MIEIQFSTSTAFASGIIRRLTHSPYSHVDFVIPEGLLGVSGRDESIFDPGGVRIRPHEAWPYLTKPKVAKIECSQQIEDAVLKIAKSQMEKPFDHTALWGFVDDQAHQAVEHKLVRDWRDPAQWFCSELVAWSLEQGGLFPYQLVIAKNRVSPADVLLLINAYMTRDNIREFLGE